MNVERGKTGNGSDLMKMRGSVSFVLDQNGQNGNRERAPSAPKGFTCNSSHTLFNVHALKRSWPALTAKASVALSCLL